jgi:hypothetical protein
MMENNHILESIKEELRREGVDSFIQRDELVSRLLVYAGSDQEKTQLIEIMVQNAEITSAIGCLSLQFKVSFPFVVKDTAVVDVTQFLHFLNLQLEIPGLFFNHLDNTIVYRYVLLAEEGHLPKKVMMSLIGISMFIQDVFGQVLERLSLGEVSFVELLKEVQKVLEKAS